MSEFDFNHGHKKRQELANSIANSYQQQATTATPEIQKGEEQQSVEFDFNHVHNHRSLMKSQIHNSLFQQDKAKVKELKDRIRKLEEQEAVSINNKNNIIPKGALGLTRNGHAVYENNKKADHAAYAHFTIEDHQDAAQLHREKQAEYQELWNKQSEHTRRTSGTKGYRIHPIDTKRNTHGQRAIEHDFEISRLKREQSNTN